MRTSIVLIFCILGFACAASVQSQVTNTTIRTQDDERELEERFTVSPRQAISFRLDRVMVEELGLLDEQLSDIRKLQGRFRELSRSEIVVPEGLEADDQIEFVRKHRREMLEDFEKEIESILLPAQIERLNQIRLQQQIGTQVTGRAFGNPQVIKLLDLSYQEALELQKRAREIRNELDEKIAELRKEAEQELLAELTEKQREMLQGALGEKAETAYERRAKEMEEDDSNNSRQDEKNKDDEKDD